MKQKQVAPAGKATPVKIPDPPSSKTALIHWAWQNHKTKYQSHIDDFRQKLEPNAEGEFPSISHVIEWDGQKTMVAEGFLLETRWAERFITPLAEVKDLPDDVQTLAKLQEVMEDQMDRITNELLGREGLGSGGSGPWEGNSTNPLANVQRMAQCTAKREALSMIRTMLRLLEGQ
jgi:hypothetical protein